MRHIIAIAAAAALTIAAAVPATATLGEANAIADLWDWAYEESGTSGTIKSPTDPVAIFDNALEEIGHMALSVTEACTDYLADTANLLAVSRAFWAIEGDTPTHDAMVTRGIEFPLFTEWEDEGIAGIIESSAERCVLGL